MYHRKLLSVLGARWFDSGYVYPHSDQTGRLADAEGWSWCIVDDEIAVRKVISKEVVVIEEAHDLVPDQQSSACCCQREGNEHDTRVR